MKNRDKTLVPRNPFAVAASQRKAGAHEKTEKTKRRDARQALKRELAGMKKGGFFPPFFMPASYAKPRLNRFTAPPRQRADDARPAAPRSRPGYAAPHFSAI